MIHILEGLPVSKSLKDKVFTLIYQLVLYQNTFACFVFKQHVALGHYKAFNMTSR